MLLKEEYTEIVGCVEANSDILKNNSDLYEINEGDILKHVLMALSKQFSNNTFEQMTHRVPPINLLKKIIDKLSTIYQPGPTRSVVDGSDADKDLLGWYEKKFKMNRQMNLSNEYFNLFKNTLIQIVLVDGVPTLRPIPSDRFFVLGKDPMNPTKVTHVVLLHGMHRSINQKITDLVQIYSIWTPEEFLIVESGAIRTDMMAALANDNGINPFGALPFVYVKRSANEIIPLPDSDMYNMSLIVPQAFTDLNAGVMFQIFSIFYGIDLDQSDLIYAPNAFWNFKSDPSKETKPEIGILKPSVDVDKAITLVMTEITLWLQSLGIRPGAIGQVNADNFASGVSKIVDEMDTTDHKLKQIGFFLEAEEDIWNFIINHAHPYWMSTNQLDTSLNWSKGVEIQVNFADQIPLQSRGEIVKEQRDEVDSRFTTRRRAIKKLNPEMTDFEVDELIEEIDAENAIKIDLNGEMNSAAPFQGRF